MPSQTLSASSPQTPWSRVRLLTPWPHHRTSRSVRCPALVNHMIRTSPSISPPNNLSLSPRSCQSRGGSRIVKELYNPLHPRPVKRIKCNKLGTCGADTLVCPVEVAVDAVVDFALSCCCSFLLLLLLFGCCSCCCLLGTGFVNALLGEGTASAVPIELRGTRALAPEAKVLSCAKAYRSVCHTGKMLDQMSQPEAIGEPQCES
jgi:hypothetical protein